MNNRENQLEQQEQAPVTEISQQTDAVKSSRRRILRAGLKAAPVVVATLAARPSLACHCVLPSAWGSINAVLGGDQDMGNQGTIDKVNKFTGSMARYKNSILDGFPSLTFNDFGSTGAGWTALKAKYPFPSDVTKPNKINYLKGNYASASKGLLNVDGLCKAIGYVTPTGAGAAKAYDLINTTGGFGASVLIAQINLYLGRIPTECLAKPPLTAKQVLDQMATGSYTIPQTSETWTSGNGQIADYLHYNWLARRS